MIFREAVRLNSAWLEFILKIYKMTNAGCMKLD